MPLTSQKVKSHALPIAATAVGATVLIGGGVAVYRQAHRATLPANMVYAADGYGGYRSLSKALPPVAGKPVKPTPTPDPLTPALNAYEKGKFTEAETAAQGVRNVEKAKAHADVPARRRAVKALHLMAFAAARRHDLKTARDRFAQVKVEAAALPDHGKPIEKPALGEDPEPTFEENAAYQHAVCTAAMGDATGAEAEYVAFMRQYPDSPLLAAAVKRIGRLHGGDVPPADEAVWRTAMATASAHQSERVRNESLCGPACLAELLRRQSGRATASATALAREMQTSDQGTSLLRLQTVARQHGFPQAQGVALTMRGLAAQHLPIVGWVAPGHFVLVEAVTGAQAGAPGSVRIWDPDPRGNGAGMEKTLAASRWQQMWNNGIALLPSPAVQVATAK